MIDLYSERKNDKHQEIVGLLLRMAATKVLKEWKPRNSRILTAHLVTVHEKVTVVQYYASTNNSNEQDKDSFCERLASSITITLLSL